MSYIGNEPTTGHFPVQTNLAGDGSATTFTLDRAPATAGAIEVSVAGVIQPTTSYSVNGTTLTMAGVANTIPIFIRYLGETLSIPVPGDGTVTTVKIADNAITAAKIADGTVVAAEIGADAIDGTKLADNAVDSEHYTDGSIDAAHLSANSIDSASYVDGSIDLAHMSVNSIDSDQYVDGSIDNIHTNFQPGTTFKGDGSSASGKIVLNCEQNSHAVSIQAPAHSAGATYTLTLPTSDGAANEVLQTNGSGVLTWVPLGTILDGSPDTDHTANGPQTNTYAAGYGATVMDLVYMGGSSKWLKADADQSSTAISLLGISLESKTDTQAMNVALPGSFVRDESWSFTPGLPLYIHTTDGSITATKPTGSSDIIRTVGFSVHAKYIFFNPSSDYITLA